MGMVASKKPSVSPSTEAQLEGLAKLLTNAKGACDRPLMQSNAC